MAVQATINNTVVSGSPEDMALFVNALGTNNITTPTTTKTKVKTKSKVKKRMSKWSTEETDTLLNEYGTTSTKSLARRLGRSTASVYVRANQLGLRVRQPKKEGV